MDWCNTQNTSIRAWIAGRLGCMLALGHPLSPVLQGVLAAKSQERKEYKLHIHKWNRHRGYCLVRGKET